MAGWSKFDFYAKMLHVPVLEIFVCFNQTVLLQRLINYFIVQGKTCNVLFVLYCRLRFKLTLCLLNWTGKCYPHRKHVHLSYFYFFFGINITLMRTLRMSRPVRHRKGIMWKSSNHWRNNKKCTFCVVVRSEIIL